MKTLYVGNLSVDSSEEEVRTLFAPYGPVHALTLIVDRLTGRSRGFGFVDLDDLAAQRAMTALNCQLFGGRKLRVDETGERPRSPRFKTISPASG
ncbi:MAG: RNA-binding protein [Desulfobulbaceae bacterium]|nr:RNA-binding protein [Desulfobulbaceae bacterium]